MTFLEALRMARPLIKSGEERYICDALCAIGQAQWRYRVARLLAPADSYEGWMCLNHPEVRRRMSPADFRAGRLQWIDHMIAEEVKKGRK